MSRPKRALAASVATLALLLLPSTSSAEPGIYPGLPSLDPVQGFPPSSDRNVFSWLNAPYNGRAGSVYSKQWARMPIGTLASNIVLAGCQPLVTPCELPDDVEFSPTAEGVNVYALSAFLVSPDGSENAYGSGTIIPVRTVAFGSIPIEVELQVEQARDADGLPIPIEGRLLDEAIRTSPTSVELFIRKARLTGQVSLRVVNLRVDGIDVGIGGSCVTSSTDLNLTSKEASQDQTDPYAYNPRETAYGFNGGGFAGTIEIPSFARCATSSGDDVAPLLTSALSGPDNPVSVQYGFTACGSDFTEDGNFKPTPPGADTPDEAGCFQFQPDPDRHPDFFAIQKPWDFPDYAPGEQPDP